MTIARWVREHLMLLITAVAVVVAVAVGQLAGAGAMSVTTTLFVAPVAVAYLVMGELVLAAEPGNPVGRLMRAAGLVSCADLLALSWSDFVIPAWAGQWCWWPPFGLIALALLVFPDGTLPGRYWRLVAGVLAGGTLLGTLGLAVAALEHPRDLLTRFFTFAGPASPAVHAAAAGMVAVAAGMAGMLVALWLRWRRTSGDARRQLAYLLAAAVLLAIGLVLNTLAVPGAPIVVALSVPLGMTVAMVRHRLYGLDQVLNRAIVWSIMTLVVIAGYVVLVGMLGRAVLGNRTSVASLVVTGLIAMTFEPLRRWVQRAVERLLFGDRDDPYRVIAELGDLLGRAVDPSAVLPSLTATVARSLRVPYVALESTTGDGPRLLAEHGRATTATESFEMIAHGERIGRLLVAIRSPGSPFTAPERRLLGDVAMQAAVAVAVTRMIRDLRDARERLVLTREEERQRLRRDLHDGLGPALMGMSMRVHTASTATELADDLRDCVVEVRRLVDQLRPPALDDGLENALRTGCRKLTEGGLTARLTVVGSLDGLPPAVEVAAYRIFAEAVTNAARHAWARTCAVAVRRDRCLTMEIVDDGIGINGGRNHGVGLASMRERAAELGGHFDIGAGPAGGTAIHVRLPVS
ncbi:histidine kinase [Actinoplanes oblitus]|uniref:histidine kinase n=1 Tax=Actinoplanes oblitus TaxID=3040509 RepID=A0ABY8W7F0_9ACTN|nr:ATP-binding protein [Actinoplanes oblitus]WIM93593.1 histidine kinase [Actinoplanes oblitus]